MKWQRKTLADQFYLNPNIQIFPNSVSRERSSMRGESQGKAGAVSERQTQGLSICRQESRPKGLFFIKSDDFQSKHCQGPADFHFRHPED